MSDYPYPEDKGQTHYANCWRYLGHHNCSVAEIERLRAELADIKKREPDKYTEHLLAQSQRGNQRLSGALRDIAERGCGCAGTYIARSALRRAESANVGGAE